MAEKRSDYVMAVPGWTQQGEQTVSCCRGIVFSHIRRLHGKLTLS